MVTPGQSHDDFQVAAPRYGVEDDVGGGRRDLPDDGVGAGADDHGDGGFVKALGAWHADSRLLPENAQFAPFQAARGLQVLRTLHLKGQRAKPVVREPV